MGLIDDLVKRSANGGPISAAQHDSNLEKIATAVDQNKATGVSAEPQVLVEGASNTFDWDVAKGGNASILLKKSLTMKVTGVKMGDFGTIVVKQDAKGGHNITLSGTSKVIAGGNGRINLTSNPGAVDILTFYYDGSDFYWSAGYNYI